jgi:hypothetical protein
MKKTCWVAICTAIMGLVAGAHAGDIGKMDRTIKKEPAYRSKAPRYALLVFGPEAKNCVWLVNDGDSLYVDRDGSGDLTQADKKISFTPDQNRNRVDGNYDFEAGELHVAGKVHHGLMVSCRPITNYGDAVQKQPNAKAALAADPHARVYSLSLDVEISGLKGQGVDGRVIQSAGPRDTNGALLFGDSPATAPVIHFGGPLEITFYGRKPTITLERSNDLILVVGTPGEGPGTFAMLGYEGTIPLQARVSAEILFPASAIGKSPVREQFELKERC